jgi:hypothetical protein
MLKLSGIFSNENDLKIVSNTLKIDKKENLTYNEDVFIDYLLIEKLNPFIAFSKLCLKSSSILLLKASIL